MACVPPSSCSTIGEDLEGGEAENQFDLDVGVLAVAGPCQSGRSSRATSASRSSRDGALPAAAAVRGSARRSTPRSGRRAAADDRAGCRRRRPTTTGPAIARIVAVGAEQWLLARRLGVRGGARFNTVGDAGAQRRRPASAWRCGPGSTWTDTSCAAASATSGLGRRGASVILDRTIGLAGVSQAQESPVGCADRRCPAPSRIPSLR